jgi:hypothetical protein
MGPSSDKNNWFAEEWWSRLLARKQLGIEMKLMLVENFATACD